MCVCGWVRSVRLITREEAAEKKSAGRNCAIVYGADTCGNFSDHCRCVASLLSLFGCLFFFFRLVFLCFGPRQEGRTRISASVGLREYHVRKAARAARPGRAAGLRVKINKAKREKKGGYLEERGTQGRALRKNTRGVKQTRPHIIRVVRENVLKGTASKREDDDRAGV